MHDAGTWQAVAIAGSAPAPADIVEVIVLDPTGQRLGKLDASHAKRGGEPLAASHHAGELERLAEERHLSRLVAPVQVRPGDLALYVAHALRDELERLGGAPAWPADVAVASLEGRSGVTVGFAPRPRLDEIRTRWASVLRREIDDLGVRQAGAPAGEERERILGELERLARVALYCVDTKTLPAYELWSRIGLAQSRRFQTVLLRKTYDVVIQRDYRRPWETFQRDIQDLAASFERAGPGLAKAAPLDPHVLEQRLAERARPSAPKTSTTHSPLLRPHLRLVTK